MTTNSGAYKKGEKRPNQGRPKGLANKVTQEFRATIQALLDDNRDNVRVWLKIVAEGDPENDVKPDPSKALEHIARLAEFAAPKLGRIEHTGENGGPVQIVAGPIDERI